MIGDGVDKFLTNLDGGEDADPYPVRNAGHNSSAALSRGVLVGV